MEPASGRVLPERLVRRGLLTVRVEGNTLCLAVADPVEVLLLGDIAADTGMHGVPLLSTQPASQLARA